jgi:hypothetical protein
VSSESRLLGGDGFKGVIQVAPYGNAALNTGADRVLQRWGASQGRRLMSFLPRVTQSQYAEQLRAARWFVGTRKVDRRRI